jgi:hypothetical protein
MKRCPQCDSSFPDSHHACEFDGADLADEPRTQHVSPGVSAPVAATQSPFLRLVKSPVFLIVLGLAGVLSSLLLIGYYDAASQHNSIAESRAPQDEVSTGSGSDRVTSRSEISKPKAKDPSSTRARSLTASRSRPRLRPSSSIRNQPSRPELALQRQPKGKALQKESKQSALQRDSKENANRKESKLTAALKTTWNILKKPFKF